MDDLIFQQTTEGETVSVPRSRVFVLVDGTFVVRWNDNHVQELESGLYRAYEKKDFGAPITDYELQQLKKVGLVENYDKDCVLLQPLPESRNNNPVSPWETNRIRSYYLHTTLPGKRLPDIVALLDELGLSTDFDAWVRDDFVVLRGRKGISFLKFDDAEKARLLLLQKAPEAFGNTVIAFIETTKKN